MTPRFTANQNKIRLIGVFLSIVVMALTFQFYKAKPHAGGSAMASQAKTPDSAMFMGVRHASPKEIRTAMPEAIGRPTLLEFSSRLCHDCQKVAAVLSKTLPQYPQVYFRKVDVLEDHGKYAAIFRAFKPVSVPVLVFIGKSGDIQNVLYNYQSPEVVGSELKKLQKQASIPVASPRRS